MRPYLSRNFDLICDISFKYIAASIWEIRRINPSLTSSADKCLVTHMMEIHSSGWGRWKKRYFSKFEKTIPYVLLCQVAGLSSQTFLFYFFCSVEMFERICANVNEVLSWVSTTNWLLCSLVGKMHGVSLPLEGVTYMHRSEKILHTYCIIE